MRNSFLIYGEYEQYFDMLPPEELKILIKALFKTFKGEDTKSIEQEMNGATKMAFAFMQNQLLIDTKKYQEKCEINRANANNRKRTQTNASEKEQSQANASDGKRTQQDKDIDIDKDTDNDIDIVSKQERKKKEIINIKYNNARACESYEDIFNELEVTDCVRNALISFIKHCQVNGHVVINDKLQDIILRLDRAYGNDEYSKVKSLKTAINSGYFDILEGR